MPVMFFCPPIPLSIATSRLPLVAWSVHPKGAKGCALLRTCNSGASKRLFALSGTFHAYSPVVRASIDWDWFVFAFGRASLHHLGPLGVEVEDAPKASQGCAGSKGSGSFFLHAFEMTCGSHCRYKCCHCESVHIMCKYIETRNIKNYKSIQK